MRDGEKKTHGRSEQTFSEYKRCPKIYIYSPVSLRLKYVRVRANARTEQAGRQTAEADRNIQQTNIFIGKRKMKKNGIQENKSFSW